MLRNIVCLSLAILFYTIILLYPLRSCENIAKQEPPHVKPLNVNKTRGPVKILLVAYGRTGSSLAGELLSADETTAYFFEPFYKWVCPEAQKPKTFRIAAIHAQKLSGRSARIHFAATRQKARKTLSLTTYKKCVKISRNISNCVIISLLVL